MKLRIQGHRMVVRRSVAGIALAAALGMAGSLVPALPAAAQGPWVGVLPSANGVCPSQTSKWWVYQDNEDSNNENGRYGWIGGISSSNNIRTYLCRVDSGRFASLAGGAYRVNFAVLALGQTCPSGTVTFDRYFDDEDSGNESSSSVPTGSATRVSGGNTTFRFCWYIGYDPNRPYAPRSAFPDLGGSYGGYGPSGPGYVLEYGWVYTDDEDSNNRNWVSGLDGTLSYYRSLWLTAGGNTRLRTVRIR